MDFQTLVFSSDFKVFVKIQLNKKLKLKKKCEISNMALERNKKSEKVRHKIHPFQGVKLKNFWKF